MRCRSVGCMNVIVQFDDLFDVLGDFECTQRCILQLTDKRHLSGMSTVHGRPITIRSSLENDSPRYMRRLFMVLLVMARLQ
jgi:hypothetical protein